MVNLIPSIGGVFAVLVTVHLLADWLVQTEAMARRKSDESMWMLVLHSAAYAIAFIPFLFLLFRGSVYLTISASLTLMMSHGAIDTYTLIWLWARFVRQPVEMREDPIKGFAMWRKSPYGLLTTSGIDQFLHICFLIPIASMIVILDDKWLVKLIGTIAFFASICLALLSVATVLLLWRKPTKPSEDATTDEPAPNNEEEYDRPSMPSQHDE